MNLRTRLLQKLTSILQQPFRLGQLRELSQKGMPTQLVRAVEYLITESPDAATARVIRAAERRRSEIGKNGDNKVEIIYSPKPVNREKCNGDVARPIPGRTLEFPMSRIASTGKSVKWGAVLYLLAKESRSQRAIELGTCAGISALYLSAAPEMKSLLTVKGSSALAKIAIETLRERPNTKVVNALFDDAIGVELTEEHVESLDLAFIDGHHERTATIHYFERLRRYLRPGAIVIFDDISWSVDMRSCWLDLVSRSEFRHAVDLGEIGVCIFREQAFSNAPPPRYWDVQKILGHRAIGNPHGWSEE